MSAAPQGILAGAVARLEGFLLEPAEAPEHGGDGTAPAPPGPRPVVAVLGLAPRCGSTTVSRALAAELASRDPAAAAAVASGPTPAGVRLATPPARRLAQLLEDVPGAATGAVGRLCFVECADERALAETTRHLAPLVLDFGNAGIARAATQPADRTLLIAGPRTEAALASAALDYLRRTGPDPLLVCNPVRGAEHATGGDGHRLPYSRAAARLALGGYQPRGDLGRAVAALADLCEGAA